MSSSSSPAGQSHVQLNLYDIFANILPGAYLLIGLIVPEWIAGGNFPNVSVLGTTAALVVAFVLGFCLQALGSCLLHGSRPFNEMMSQDGGDGTGADGISYSDVDELFCQFCKDDFGVDPRSADGSRLFKLVISDIETGGQQRALRIQALHLAARGLFLASVPIALYHFVRMMPLLPLPRSSSLVIHWYVFAVAIALAPIFYYRYRDFERDVAMYMIYDFVLERKRRACDVDGFQERSADGGGEGSD